jgi:tetratricopeptide (TPR) repeat protein
LHLTAALSAGDKHTAEKIKNDGNALFKKGKFAAAIDLYTEALLHAPDMHVIYVNRAMSYLKLEKWEQCEQDARSALAIQSGLIKVGLSRRCMCTTAFEHFSNASVLTPKHCLNPMQHHHDLLHIIFRYDAAPSSPSHTIIDCLHLIRELAGLHCDNCDRNVSSNQSSTARHDWKHH